MDQRKTQEPETVSLISLEEVKKGGGADLASLLALAPEGGGKGIVDAKRHCLLGKEKQLWVLVQGFGVDKED